jgi:hypothetical protein
VLHTSHSAVTLQVLVVEVKMWTTTLIVRWIGTHPDVFLRYITQRAAKSKAGKLAIYQVSNQFRPECSMLVHDSCLVHMIETRIALYERECGRG